MINIRKLLNVGEESRLTLLPRRRRLSDTPEMQHSSFRIAITITLLSR